MMALCSSTPDGVDNLLGTCIQMQAGDRVLLILEPEGSEFFEPGIDALITQRIRKYGGLLTTMKPDLITHPAEFPDAVSSAMGEADHTLFVSRLGDYVRFMPSMGNGSKTICYPHQLQLWHAPFARVCHRLMTKLLHRLESELTNASQWRITCPLGTDISGRFCWPSQNDGVDDTFSMGLFPVTTFKPVPCDTANGSVALSRWVMPGAAAKVEPAVLNFEGVVHAYVRNGSLDTLKGNPDAVQSLNDYYDRVSRTLQTNKNRIHSWHLGINPMTFFNEEIDRHLEQWAAISFASPRYLHFHTCGDVPPGEIAWSIFQPSVWVDDLPYWQNGEFVWLQRKDNAALIRATEGAACLLAPSQNIGL